MIRSHKTHRIDAHRQRGVVLFIALIAMVILSLAGVALVRSVDTSTGVAGNIAFRQASIAAVNEAIENSVNAVFKAKTIPTQTANDAASHYYAAIQPNEKKNGVPDVLSGDYATMAAAYTGAGFAAPVADPVSGVEVRWVIERVCNAAGGLTTATCDTLPPKVSPAGTDNKYKPIPLPPIPNFRVTVRVDLPAANTLTYAQAFLQ